MSTVKELSDSDINDVVNQAEVPVLIDFSATWCGPCKALAPTIDKVAAEYGDRLAVYKVDIDQAPNATVNFGVRAVPTCLFFRGGEVVDRFQGNLDLRHVKEMVDKVLA